MDDPLSHIEVKSNFISKIRLSFEIEVEGDLIFIEFADLPSDDLDLVIAAMNVQREVGGNLAEILDIISHTIRERVRIKGEIRVLTSQVMYSGRFLALMPLMITAALFLLNRPYMMLFFDPETRIVGIPMLIVGALMIASGYFVMTKIATIDV